jgi:RND family efflux transporter MFP subunit
VFGVPDYILKEIKPGDSLGITVEALRNEEFPGTVTAVSPSADPKGRVFEVEITVPNPGMVLKDGMIAAVRVASIVKEAHGAVAPLHAVVRPPGDSQGFMVFLVREQDGKCYAQGRKVSIGKVFGNKVAITDGLVAGERIVTTGATLVHEGATVQIIP